MLTVYIDFKSSGSYLAMAPTLALAARLNLPVQWRPFRTIERDVPQLTEHETVGESHRRVRAASQRALAIKYAAHQGIELKFPQRLGASDLALGVLAEIDGDKRPFIESAFQAYWSAHLDLDADQVVADLVRDSGVAHRGDLSSARTSLDVAQTKAEEAGIVGAPAYVIEDQIFIGREHLPWIEEIARQTV